MATPGNAASSIARQPPDGSLFKQFRRTLAPYCPQALLNWREARFYGRYGEVELHLLEFLCHRSCDAIDVGANDGSYVHFLRRYARRVIAFEPLPVLADALTHKFHEGVIVKAMALSDRAGTAELNMPVVDGVTVTGCSTISATASITYPTRRSIKVPMDCLDSIYGGNVGFIKIDVEGHEQAVLDGAARTIRRCQPRMLVELDERLSPGGLACARTFFDRLGYRGYFVYDGHLEPIERFSIARMQDPANLPNLIAPLQARQRFGRYVYNFIFLPPDEPEKTLRQISDRLSQIAA